MYANNLKKKLSRQSNTQSRKEFCAVMDEKNFHFNTLYSSVIKNILYTCI